MINLLPPEHKEELKEEESLKLALTLGIIILAFLVSLILILFSIKISLLADLDVQESYIEQEQERLKIPEMQELRAKIQENNLILSKLEAFYQDQSDLILLLEKISRAFPEKIYLTSFNLKSQTSQVSLTGFSPTCEMLLQFKGNLEKTEGLKEIVFPSDTWFQDTNINFLVSFKI
ncbi:MAG TPA: PilN domain-containing protein [Candidatus Humimicrobiaceae bacterium]|nr:PilN domain-containing protein [Candidatus Humimicrobiaceae bacterium]